MEQIDLNDFRIAFNYKSDKELRKTLFIYRLIQRPAMVKFLTKLALMVLKYRLPFKFMLKSTIFEIFCAGENRVEAQKTMNKLKKHKVNTVLDYVAEGDNSEEGFERNLEIILDNIHFVGKENEEAFVGVKLSGLEDVNFIQTLNSKTISKNLGDSVRLNKLIMRVEEICELALKSKVKVYFDAEERNTQDVYDFIIEKMMEKYNKKEIFVYNTLQMYLKDRIEYLSELIEQAKDNGYKLGLKLVRGAYVEKEREEAKIHGIPSPVFETKEETDKAFDQAVKICLENHELIHTCLATHNQQSVKLAVDLIKELNITDHFNKVYFSQLFGMSDNLTFNLANGNYNSSKYVPYGEVEKAIPYLLRRAEENSSIEGQASREYELLMNENKRRQL